MYGSVTARTLYKVTRDRSTQLAVEVVEEIVFPLFVLFRRHPALLHYELGLCL